MASPPRRIRVLIADDNRAVRRGLRLLLDNVPNIRVVAEVSNGLDAVTVALAEQIDVVLMDMQMPGLTGAEATREILRQHREVDPAREIAVLVMTSFALDGYVTEALDAGAIGYLLKSHDSDQLVDAIYSASRGEAVMSPRVVTPVLREFVRRGGSSSTRDQATLLSSAERRVVAALSSGVTSNEGIADYLHVSIHTVRSQLQSALKKTGLDDRTQLALWGVRNRLDTPAS